MSARAAALVALALAACGDSPPREASGPDFRLAPEDRVSGATFLQPDTRALQEDDFANPGFLWVEAGARLFAEPAGSGPACASCHDGDTRPLEGAAARYPAIDAQSGALLNLEGRINACRVRHQDVEPLAYDSDDLLALTAHVASLSRGTPVRVDITGPARPHFEAGRAYFMSRRGQLDLACTQCHDDHWGRKLRGDTISQGHPTAFPAYRLEWQALGSLHRRFHDCDAGVRAAPMAPGSETYVALELYLAARAEGLALEAPGVRR